MQNMLVKMQCFWKHVTYAKEQGSNHLKTDPSTLWYPMITPQWKFADIKYLLFTKCEIIKFVLAIPIKTIATQVVAKELTHIVIYILAHQNS